MNMIHLIIKRKGKNHMILSTEEALEKIQHPFFLKAFKKIGIEGTYVNIIKAIHKRPTVYIILNGEKLRAFPLKEQDRDVHSHHCCST